MVVSRRTTGRVRSSSAKLIPLERSGAPDGRMEVRESLGGDSLSGSMLVAIWKGAGEEDDVVDQEYQGWDEAAKCRLGRKRSQNCEEEITRETATRYGPS